MYGVDKADTQDLAELEAKLSPYMNVVDVYEAASSIGRDLEHLAEKYGTDAIEKIVPKICAVLEHLEATATRSEREEKRFSRLQQLQQDVVVLHQERKQMRERHAADLEQLDADWRAEVAELTEALQRLTKENAKLCSALQAAPSPICEEKTLMDRVDENNKQLNNLQESLSSRNSLSTNVMKVKEELRQRERDLETALLQLESTQARILSLTKSLKDQKKRYKNLNSQCRRLMEENNDITGQLREVIMKNVALEHQLASRESGSSPDNQPQDDGQKPIYTLNELSAIINERNHLKTKVMELQEELDALKNSASSVTSEVGFSAAEEEIEEPEPNEDLPVQGPINREPEEKLPEHKKGSIIRNLFRNLFGENSIVRDGIFNSLKDGNFSHLNE